MEKEHQETYDSLFDRPEFEAFKFWNDFENYMRSIKIHANYLLQNKHKQQRVVDCLIMIKEIIDDIKDLLYRTYGLVLDTNPCHTKCIEDKDAYHLIDFYFWSLDYHKQIEYIINNSSNIGLKLEKELNDKRQYQHIEVIFESLNSIISLMANTIQMPVMLLNDFDLYLREFRKSKVGERMVSGWRKDYLLSQEQLLQQLKEIKRYRPWVDKCRWLHEGKIERRELWVDITIPGIQYNNEKYKTSSWFSIFSLMSILKEFEKKHEELLKENDEQSEDMAKMETKDEKSLIETIIRRSIERLMQEHIIVKKSGKDEDELLFNLQNHWQAVYRVLVDKKYCKDSDFEGFDTFISPILPSNVNKPYKKESVKQISKTDYNIPFEKWKYNGETSGRRKIYDRMYAITKRFKEILEEEGL